MNSTMANSHLQVLQEQALWKDTPNLMSLQLLKLWEETTTNGPYRAIFSTLMHSMTINIWLNWVYVEMALAILEQTRNMVTSTASVQAGLSLKKNGLRRHGSTIWSYVLHTDLLDSARIRSSRSTASITLALATMERLVHSSLKLVIQTWHGKRHSQRVSDLIWTSSNVSV